jgi:hypothetical protein
MKVKPSDRSLAIFGIYEKLGRCGMDKDKISFGNMGIPDTLTKGFASEPSIVEALYCRDFSEYVEKIERGEPVVPLTFVHALDAPRFVEYYSDNTAATGFSIDDTILHQELVSEGYTLVGIRDHRGVLQDPDQFETSQQRAAAKLAALHALKDSVRGPASGSGT